MAKIHASCLAIRLQKQSFSDVSGRRFLPRHFSRAPDLSFECGPSLAFAKNTAVLQSTNNTIEKFRLNFTNSLTRDAGAGADAL